MALYSYHVERVHVYNPIPIPMPSEPPDRAQRELLGRFATRVAGEFEHLLARMAKHFQRIDDVAGDRAEVQDELADGRELIARGQALLRQLSAFAGDRNLAPNPVDLRAAVGAWWPSLQAVVGPNHPLELRMRGRPRAAVDEQALLLALENLCVNAREACPAGTPIELDVSDASDGGVELRLRDAGHGMDAERVELALEPFFTSKPRHMGLGLSATAAIIAAHGGRLQVHSEPEHGTTVVMWLPASANTAMSDDPLPRVRVLVIDPERLIVRWMQRSLTSKGCEVRIAADVLAAREALRDDWAELVILDRNLPDGDGRNFAIELARDRG